MIIHNYEKGQRSSECVRYLTQLETLWDFDTLIVLPIPTSRDGNRLTNTDIEIKNVLENVCGKTLIIGYEIPLKWVEEMHKLGAAVCDSSLDEEFLKENGRLTAECTIGVLINSTSRSLSEMSFGVVGYGRIGKWLLRYLSYLSAKVTVYTRSIDTRLDLAQSGVYCENSEEPCVSPSLDVLINTAPRAIFSKASFSGNENVRIIDLASGDNFPFLERVEKYPSIPAKMLPFSAGLAWGRSVQRMFSNNT